MISLSRKQGVTFYQHEDQHTKIYLELLFSQFQTLCCLDRLVFFCDIACCHLHMNDAAWGNDSVGASGVRSELSAFIHYGAGRAVAGHLTLSMEQCTDLGTRQG